MENEKLKEDLIEALAALAGMWNYSYDPSGQTQKVLIKHGLLNNNDRAKRPTDDDWPANLMVFKK